MGRAFCLNVKDVAGGLGSLLCKTILSRVSCQSSVFSTTKLLDYTAVTDL